MTRPANEQPKLDLEPCPFCGSAPHLGDWATHYVKCDECGVQVIGLTPAEAVANWNTRSPALIARVREAEKPMTGDWILVPREPTREMRQAGADATFFSRQLGALACVGRDRAMAAYTAMLSASPSTPDEGAWPDELIEETAKAIAVNGFGRPWDDFLPCNVHDTDQGDLQEYAVAALDSMRGRGLASPFSGISREKIARIIDPEAWVPMEDVIGVRKSLAKADVILALTAGASNAEGAQEVERLTRERDAWKATAEHHFEHMRAALDLSYALKYPVDPALLERAADEIDCGGQCEHASYDRSTNVTECRMAETTGCPFDDATSLREFAKAIRIQAWTLAFAGGGQ